MDLSLSIVVAIDCSVNQIVSRMVLIPDRHLFYIETSIYMYFRSIEPSVFIPYLTLRYKVVIISVPF